MTIKDIAKLADVSVSTVSRVLNDRPDVSEDSRRRVRAVIEAHRYVPNNSARDLVKIRSDAVGLVVRGVQNPFYTDIIHAIEQKLDASGYTMVMRQIPSDDDEIQCGAVMEKEKRLRGIIFLGGRSDYSPEEVSLLGVPYVCCSYTNSYGTLPPESYSSVSIADEQEAYRAVMELAKKGHRRIAFIHGERTTVTENRLTGFYRACDALELEIPEEYVREGVYHDPDRCAELTRELLQLPEPPTCILMPDDFSSIGGGNAIRRMDLRFPEDVSAAGYDGIQLASVTNPAMTTYRQDTAALGKTAAAKLIELIEKPRTALVDRILIPGKLVEGGSVRAI